MPNSTYFVEDCPTCGRRLHVRVEYLGRKVVCQHCRGAFIAGNSEGQRPGGLESVDTLLRRADELLRYPRQRPPGSLHAMF